MRKQSKMLAVYVTPRERAKIARLMRKQQFRNTTAFLRFAISVAFSYFEDDATKRNAFNA